MSNSAHLALRDAMVARLVASNVAGGRVYANRRFPMAAQDPSAVFVYLEESQATRGQIRGAPVDWRTRVRVECVGRATVGADADAVADAVATAVYAVVLSDASLGGAAIDTEAQAMAWVQDEADTLLVSAQILFSVWHRTAERLVTP